MVRYLGQTWLASDEEDVINQSDNNAKDHESKTCPIDDELLAGQLKAFLPEKEYCCGVACTFDVEHKRTKNDQSANAESALAQLDKPIHRLFLTSNL
jgi:hypothetical protein